MVEMPFVYDDGGRAAAGFRGETRDCAARSIAIATGEPYAEVYATINATGAGERRRTIRRSGARTGVQSDTIRKLMVAKGWRWVPCMAIGAGCKVHLAVGELPMGRIIASVSKHVVAVIDGVIHDTHNPGRGGNRCVYGYFIQESV